MACDACNDEKGRRTLEGGEDEAEEKAEERRREERRDEEDAEGESEVEAEAEERRVMAAAVLGLMNDRKITSMFAVEEKKPVGIVHIHDLVRAGFV